MPQELHDSGERRTFKTGAVRDRGDLKPRPDLISPHAQMREGMIMALGAQKYELRNWEKGIPISECLASCQRHIEQAKRGDTDEDHYAQARTNLSFIIHMEEEIKAGRMDPELNDMPKYVQQDTLNTIPNIPISAVKDGHATRLIEVGEVLEISLEELQRLYRQSPKPDDVMRTIKLDADEPPTFYICGPMRGIKEFNFPLFDEVARIARAQGFNIISPAEQDRKAGVKPPTDPEELARTKKENIIAKSSIAYDVGVILGLKKDRGDGLILLPGWTGSTGGRAEVALALWLGLKFKNSTLNDLSSPYVTCELIFQEID